MARQFICLIVVLLLVGDVGAQDGGADQPAFTRFVGPKTMLVMHYRMTELLQIPAVQSAINSIPGGMVEWERLTRSYLGLRAADIESITMYLDQFIIVDGIPQPPRAPSILLTASKDLDFAVLARPLGPTQKTIQHGKYKLTMGRNQVIVHVDARSALFLLDCGNDIDVIKKLPILQTNGLENATDVPERLKQGIALAASQKPPFFIGFRPSSELRKLGEDALNQAPPILAPFKALTKMESGYVTTNYVATEAQDCHFKIVTNFPDAKSAQAGLGAVKVGLITSKMLINNLPKQEAPRNLQNFWLYAAQYAKGQLDLIKLEQQEKDVVITYQMNSQEFLPVLLLLIQKVRFATDRMNSASNMRQLMIAMHSYQNDHDRLPEAMTMKEGKPLHSWRVQILPYLEEGKLYKQLRLDEPWDSDHNRRIFESNPMPKFFEHPYKKDGASKMTYYQVFYSKKYDAGKTAGFRLGAKFTLGQLTVTDGLSNTIAMIENGKPVLWYKPEDIEFDADLPFPKLTSPWPSMNVYVAFYDASIRNFTLGKDEATWKAIVTWNGGEAIDLSKIEE